MRVLVGVLFLTLPVVPLHAQAGDTSGHRWHACFALTQPIAGAARQVCGIVTLPTSVICGRPVVQWPIAIDSLQPPLPYHGGTVALTLTDSTLSFGERIDSVTDPHDASTRCRASGDDGSLFGQGRITGPTVSGSWGVTGLAGHILGQFTMSRL